MKTQQGETILTESQVETALESRSILTVEHYNELLSTLRAVQAILSQPVQFSNGQGGSFNIIQGDCSAARSMITQALSKETIRQESNTATP